MTSIPDREEAIQHQLVEIERIARAVPAPSPPLERIAEAVRRLGRFVNTTTDTPETLEPIADELENVLADLPGDLLPGGAARESRLHAEDVGLYNPRGTHPLLGSINPVAPPLDMRAEGDRIVADTEFDVRFEGNKGWVHGGFVAAGFDIMVVTAARLSGSGGPTGTLQVRYIAPTPICEPLRYETWFDGREGRKVHVRGRLLRKANDQILAEVEGIVIAPRGSIVDKASPV